MELVIGLSVVLGLFAIGSGVGIFVYKRKNDYAGQIERNRNKVIKSLPEGKKHILDADCKTPQYTSAPKKKKEEDPLDLFNKSQNVRGR